MTNDANAAASSPLASAMSPAVRWATALSLLLEIASFTSSSAESRSPLASSASARSESAVASPARAAQRLARLRDGCIELTRIAQRHDVERSRIFGVGVLLDENLQPVGRFLLLAAPPSHLRQRGRDLLRVGRELRARSERRLGPGQIASLRQEHAEIVVRLPQIGIDGDRFAHQADGALAPVRALGELGAGDHLRGRLRDRRAPSPATSFLLLGRSTAAERRARGHRHAGRRTLHFLPPGLGRCWSRRFRRRAAAGAARRSSGGSGAGADERISNPISLCGG